MSNSDLIRSPQPLHGMFTAVPPRYDLINRIITLGQDKHWRKKAALACLEGKPAHVLDLGCGTGDLAINIARLAGKDVQITGIDFSLPMLEIARHKAAEANITASIAFINGEATKLPFPDGYFDCVGISFAFRNLTYKNPLCELHLGEVARVLQQGGRYVIVESSQPKNRFIRACNHLYLRTFVKWVGFMLSRNRGAYTYLAESAADYYSPDEVREMLLKAGFKDVTYRPLFLGAAGIHIATR
jgi:demethylmenaquinone methyltransferase / 2-methoxy-6-polyprenyl-1,4-benzoquinol methylase